MMSFFGLLLKLSKFTYFFTVIFFILALNSKAQVSVSYYALEDVTVTTKTNIYQSDPMTKVYSLSEESEGSISDVGDVVRNISGVSIPYDISASDSLVPYSNRGFTSYKIRGLGGNRISLFS